MNLLLRGNYGQKKIFTGIQQEAVLLVKQSGSPVAEIARNLGINDNVLRRWVKEYSEPSKQVFPGQGNARDEEVARLKKELAQVKKERDFLKEAGVIIQYSR